jgi:hypothetical protein
MPLTNPTVINDEQTIQSSAQAAIASYHATSNEQAAPQRISLRKGRHLDVDEVLARSLPSLTVEGLNFGQEKMLARNPASRT